MLNPTKHDQSDAFCLPLPRTICEPEQRGSGMRHIVSVSPT